jgi:hypothetical protein
MVTGEVDVFTRVEHVNGGRVAKHMNVAKGGGKVSLGRVEAEEILNPSLLQPSLETSKERLFSVSPAFEVLA